MPFIVATYVYASSQGQRTHSARTKIETVKSVVSVEISESNLDCIDLSNFWRFRHLKQIKVIKRPYAVIVK